MEQNMSAMMLKIGLTCLRMCVSYNVENINLSGGQGLGDRALRAFDNTRVAVECILIPSLWLYEAWTQFPDLWSTQNTCLALSQGQRVERRDNKKEKKVALIPRKAIIQVYRSHHSVLQIFY